MQYKVFANRLKAGDDGRFTATITTESVDHDGEVLLTGGMDPADFERRGTIFWNHNYDRPIGKAIGPLHLFPRRAESDFVFASRPASAVGEWFPDTVKALVSQGVVKGVSVGYTPIDPPRTATAQDRKTYGPTVQRVFPRWSLSEWSIAPANCNADAMVMIGKALRNVDRRALWRAVDAIRTEPAGGLLLLVAKRR